MLRLLPVYLLTAVLMTGARAAESERRDWKVMIVVPERHITLVIPDPAAETEIGRQFLEADYKVIDRDQWKAKREEWAKTVKEPRAWSAIGRQYGADILITGEAFSVLVGRTMNGLVKCEARVECRAILVETGEILATDAARFGGSAETEPEGVVGKHGRPPRPASDRRA